MQTQNRWFYGHGVHGERRPGFGVGAGGEAHHLAERGRAVAVVPEVVPADGVPAAAVVDLRVKRAALVRHRALRGADLAVRAGST